MVSGDVVIQFSLVEVLSSSAANRPFESLPTRSHDASSGRTLHCRPALALRVAAR
jgi:hypothetical protein